MILSATSTTTNGDLNVAIGGKKATILDSEGHSSFLQLPATSKRLLAIGEAKAKWGAKGRRSEETVIVVPGITTIIHPFIQVTGRGELTAGIVGAKGNEVTVQLYDSAEELAAGSEITFYYLVIGE
jgi:hypothetical protein